MRAPIWVAFFAAASLTLGSFAAQGAEPTPADLARAKARFAEGEAAAREARWPEAIDRFEQVRAIKETPGVVFHLAAAVEADGRLAAALRLFERARDLAREGDVGDVLALADERITALNRRVPRLVVRAAAGAAGVTLDGRALSAAELGEPLRVEPGRHRVEGHLPAGPLAREVDLAEGALLTVVLGDEEASPAPEPPSAAAAPATATKPPPPTREARLPLGPIILGASGLALAAGGFVTFAVAGGTNADGAEACAAGACDPGARDTVRTLDGVALALWVGGGAAVGASFAWWALDDGEPALQARVGPGGANLRGRF